MRRPGEQTGATAAHDFSVASAEDSSVARRPRQALPAARALPQQDRPPAVLHKTAAFRPATICSHSLRPLAALIWRLLALAGLAGTLSGAGCRP